MFDERFHQFVMDHRDAINGMVTRLWPLVDEHLHGRLRRGFERCLQPCFAALSSRAGAGGRLRPDGERVMLAVTELLLLAIKKRYYAFPDKDVVAVDQEHLFDHVLPRAIEAGLLDDSARTLALLFNAGENLRELSARFYDTIGPLVGILAKHPDALEPSIHVSAWLAGDARRRSHAAGLLAAGQVPPELLPVAAFKGKVLATALSGRPIAADLHDVLARSLAGDPWLSPAVISEDPGFRALADAVASGAGSVPHGAREVLERRAAAKDLRAASAIKFLGKAGRYEGFGGAVDSPPRAIATTGEASLVAWTMGGRLLHVEYGGTGSRVHALGTAPCTAIARAERAGLLALDGRGGITSLQSGRLAGKCHRPKGQVLAAGAVERVFFHDQSSKAICYVNPGDEPEVAGTIKIKRPLSAMAAIDDDRLAAVASDGRGGWSLDELAFDGSTRQLSPLPGPSLVAAHEGLVACIEPDGTLLAIDTTSGRAGRLATFIDPATTTSFLVTRREVITTHTFTHAIHFHGPPV
ncbi:MAG: hypothetical protein JW839_03645 [Candidatus Lokiarchaeota archaeon]|nr:hypothetical protein [Candidatus Lokiarchaeota archaeon]